MAWYEGEWGWERRHHAIHALVHDTKRAEALYVQWLHRELTLGEARESEALRRQGDGQPSYEVMDRLRAAEAAGAVEAIVEALTGRRFEEIELPPLISLTEEEVAHDLDLDIRRWLAAETRGPWRGEMDFSAAPVSAEVQERILSRYRGTEWTVRYADGKFEFRRPWPYGYVTRPAPCGRPRHSE